MKRLPPRKPFLVRLDADLKRRLSKFAFRKSWKENRRCSENQVIEDAIRSYLEAAAAREQAAGGDIVLDAEESAAFVGLMRRPAQVSPAIRDAIARKRTGVIE